MKLLNEVNIVPLYIFTRRLKDLIGEQLTRKYTSDQRKEYLLKLSLWITTLNSNSDQFDLNDLPYFNDSFNREFILTILKTWIVW